MSSSRTTRGTRGSPSSGTGTSGANDPGTSGSATSGTSAGPTASVMMSEAQLQALIQAVRPPTVPQPAPAPAQAPVVPAQGPSFSLTPGQANVAQFIDYTTATGIKLWQESTAALPNKFSAEGHDANQFCEALLERAEKSGWNRAPSDIITITVNNQGINLLTEYGRITTDDITANATYMGMQNRLAQNDAQMYHCIKNSLTPEAERKILAERESYHINNVPSGPLLFKLLMQKAIIDTWATSSLMRENLSNLDSYITTVKSDIEEFNRYVKMNYQGLQARGERCDDIMVHLFKAYLVASDREFVTYIKLKKMEHEEGRNRYTPEELMTLALNKYAILHKQNLWNTKSPEEEKVLALTSKVQKLSDANLKLTKYLEDKKNKNTKKGSNKKGKEDKDEKWAWKKKPPKSGKPWTKKFNEKTYHWCKWHKAWVVHDPATCRLRAESETSNNANTSDSQDANDQSGTQVQATQAIVTDLVNTLQQE